MNCPSRRATAISPAGRRIRARIPPWSLSAPPVRGGQSGGTQPVPMIVPAHTTRHGVAAVAGSQAGGRPRPAPTKKPTEKEFQAHGLHKHPGKPASYKNRTTDRTRQNSSTQLPHTSESSHSRWP